MKYFFLYLLFIFSFPLFSQTLQLHYDFRHSIDPEVNDKNFPTLYFEYFKQKDFGSLLVKIQSDFTGEGNNIGKFYMQASQTMRFWKPGIYLQIEYSGGMGIAEPGQFGYYINNAFSIGSAYPFQWDSAWFNASLCYTFNAFKIPSHDFLFSFYWGKGFWNYQVEFIGDIDIYTLNKNQGDAYTLNQHGKRFCFLAEPQLWFNITQIFSVGTKINLYYHVLSYKDNFQVYPTLAVRYKL